MPLPNGITYCKFAFLVCLGCCFPDTFAAQLIFGAIAAKGQLPVSINNLNLSEGLGIKTKTLDRLSYGIPESVGMSSHKLERIDSLANYAIENQMTPGIQLMVARHGKVIYDKSFINKHVKKLLV